MTEATGQAAALARAEAQIAALEREIARITEDGLREADAMFAQYQLTQLLAAGGSTAELSSAVAAELARLADAAAVGVWSKPAGRGPWQLVGRAGSLPGGTPESIDAPGEGRSWAARQRGAVTLLLQDHGPIGLLVLLPRHDVPLDADGLRVIRLARHELALAIRDARLRQALDTERRDVAAIVDGATDSILQVDHEGRLVRANDAAERLLGRSRDALIGLSCGAALGCERAGGHAESACPLREVLAGGDPIPNRDTAVVADGGRVVEMVGGYARTGGDGGPLRAIAILRDVSGAHALAELREGFVATVSHELRTPLALIKGYAETILHLDPPPDEARAYVERIDQLADRLRGLVTAILDVTHLQADPLVLEPSPCRLEALAGRLESDLAVTEDAGRLVVDLPLGLPPAEVDPIRIGQVLENLVDNARKYAPAGSPIVITAEADDAWLTVAVLDAGVGVPGGDRSLILEPFHRGRNVRESSIPGTGLGLAISKRIVEAHGGRLWLEERSDGAAGTRAAFTIPVFRSRARSEPSAVADPAAVGAGTSTEPAGGDG